ncbi:MAG TPA: hypothetical protein DEF68_03235, partial [Elusimicrobia bacterium]|nr:hypothetical protein [Elusimicrobiota bacterium]HBW22378.1 hypothetical protein [Elusimicrobiota bacterium]
MSVVAMTSDLTSFPAGSGNSAFGSPYNGIDLPAGTVSQNGIWGIIGIPYLLRSGNVVIGAAAKVTVLPGTVLKSLSSRLQIDGTLLAVGTPEAPIVFTSLRDDTIGGDSNLGEGAVSPARGNWLDVYMNGPGSSGSRLENVIIRWGGGTYMGPDLYLSNSTAAVRNCDISNSAYDGIRVDGAAAAPLIDGCYLHDNAGQGIHSAYGSPYGSLGGPVALRNNVFARNGGWGAYLNLASEISSNTFDNTNNGIYISSGSGTGIVPVSSNTFINNAGSMVQLNANVYLTGSGNIIGAGNKYAGISLGAATWSANGTWGMIDLPYLLRSGNNVAVGAGAKVTILPGTVLKSLGSRLQIDGTLLAVGTPEAPIVFTSLRDDTIGGDSNLGEGAVSPARGNWLDVYMNGPGSSGSRLENVIIRWGGGTYQGPNLYLSNSTATIKYSQIRLSNNYGIRVEGASAKPLILGTLITENPYGVYAQNSAMPEIHGCNIQGNTSYGVYNTFASTSAVVKAQNNYWGHATGPKDTSNNASDPTHLYNPGGQGDTVNDYIDYSNFLSTPASIIQPVVLSALLLNPSPARPGATVAVRIYFNEDMDPAVSPIITYGQAAPYDSYTISGGTWTAANTFEDSTLLPALPDGAYTAKITGARDFVQNIVTPGEQPFYTIDGTPPQPPALFGATPLSGGRITLSWTAPAGEPAASYSLYRATFDFASIAGLSPVRAGISTTSVIDLPPADGVYFYSATALDAAGNESAPSYRPSASSVRVPPAIPENLTAVFVPASKNIALAWEPPLSGSAASYNLYRATYAASGTTGMTLVRSSVTAAGVTDAPLADAVYYYRVTALDILGNESPGAAAPAVAFDIHAPVITVSGFADGGHYKSDVSLLVTTADFSPVESTVTLNGAVTGNAAVISEPGRYTLAVDARDSFGLSTSVVRGFVIDRTAPHLSVIYPAGGLVTNQDVTIVYVSTDDFSASGQLIVKDDQNRAPPLTYAADGVKSVTLTSKDLAGNISTATVNFTLDKTRPAAVTDLRLDLSLIASGKADLAFTAPADNLSGTADYIIKAATFPISGTSFDTAPVLLEDLAAQPPGSAELFSIPVSTAATLYFALKSRDAAGNFSDISNAAVMDMQAPSLTAVSPAPAGYISRPTIFSVQAADDLGVTSVVFSVDGADLSTRAAPPYSFKWDILAFADGAHTLAARAADAAGNRKTVSAVYNVLYQPPPAPVITSPYSGYAIAIPTFTVTGTAEPGTTVQLRINGNVSVSAPAAADGSYLAIVTLPSEGAYTLTAFATDARGAGSPTAPVSIEYNFTAPGAPSSVSATAMPGGRVHLTWLAPSGKAPAHYRVYRGNTEESLVAGAPAVPGLLIAGSVAALTLDNTPPADGFYYYAVTARDAAGNESVLSDIAYAVSDAHAPSASVVLPGITPPLGAGAYPAQVTVSEVLTAAPYFTFTPAGGAPVLINLGPSAIANVWVATLTITQAMPSGAGRFSFQGTDLSGNSGQTITSGSTLVLETAGPVADISFVPAAGLSLKEGEYQIRLTLNKAALATPVFAYNKSTGSLSVSLSSSTNAAVWDGAINVSTATGEGSHNFTYSSLDSLGNTGTLISGATYFIADTIAPGAPLAFNWSNGADGLVKLTWSGALGEKASSYCVYRDNALLNCSVIPNGDGSGVFNDTPPVDGAHGYYATALDKAGNESAASNGITAQSDAVPPSAPTAVSASPAEAGGVEIIWSAGPGEAPAGFRLYRSTSAITSVSGLPYRAVVGGQSTDQPQTDGVYYYAITAVDLAGNESAMASSGAVGYDKAAPVITISGITDGALYNGEIRPVFSAYDLNLDTGSITALLDAVPFESGSVVRTAGGHTLIVSASDISGHNASKTVSFDIDLSSPVITLAGITDGGVYTAAVNPVFSASDANLSAVTALLNGVAFVSGTAVTANNAYTLAVTAADRAGNISRSSASFAVDLPPQKAQNLAALIEDGSSLALSWTAAGAGVSLYKVFKDGVYLGPVGADKNYYKDTAYSAGAHIYEVLAVDSKGRDGVRARAELPAVSLVLSGYGSFSGDSQALNRGFFDYVRFTITNSGAQAVSAGPLALTAGGVQGVAAPAVTVQAGVSAEASAVVYTSTQAAGTLSARGVLSLPRGGDAVVSAAINFNLTARDAQNPIVEVLPDALVRGSYSDVRVKFNNRGSAPADIVTARKPGGVVSASDLVSVSFLAPSGFVLGSGLLKQTNADIAAIAGETVYFVRVPPGGSVTFDPVRLPVPESADTIKVRGSITGFAYSLGYNPVHSTQAYSASKDVKTELAIPYTATISPEHSIYDQGSSVKIMGRINDVWSNVLSSFPVVVSISNNGYTRSMQGMTDGSGNYNVTFTPNPAEAGVYSVGVRHPDIVGEAATSSFIITGFGFNYRDYSLTMLQGSSYLFDVILKNTGGSQLEGLSFTVEPVSGEGVTLTPSQVLPQTLPPGSQMKITLACAAISTASAQARMNFKVTDINGFTRSMSITVNVVAPQV